MPHAGPHAFWTCGKGQSSRQQPLWLQHRVTEIFCLCLQGHQNLCTLTTHSPGSIFSGPTRNLRITKMLKKGMQTHPMSLSLSLSPCTSCGDCGGSLPRLAAARLQPFTYICWGWRHMSKLAWSTGATSSAPLPIITPVDRPSMNLSWNLQSPSLNSKLNSQATFNL